MAKKISFKTKDIKKNADDWVEKREIKTSSIEINKRLTIDIPESLHKKIKSTCALNGTSIADEIRNLLKSKFQ
ncbi:plasmid partition protein ParG [Arsenophonus sp.]|uniref:plasmid partition protein ParG n=1 Tax=Arsenophonus sp. TaxID=1872640 RepID=UPI00387A202F